MLIFIKNFYIIYIHFSDCLAIWQIFTHILSYIRIYPGFSYLFCLNSIYIRHRTYNIRIII